MPGTSVRNCVHVGYVEAIPRQISYKVPDGCTFWMAHKHKVLNVLAVSSASLMPFFNASSDIFVNLALESGSVCDLRIAILVSIIIQVAEFVQ